MDNISSILLSDLSPKMNRKKTPSMDEDFGDYEQTFDDHHEICRRLERTLGIYKRPDRLGFEDWTAFASIIGSQYADQFDPYFASKIARRNVSPSALLLCVIYLERLHLADPKFRTGTSMSSSELFLVSLMSACKFLYDVGELGDCYNGSWAKHFKVPLKDLNRMETSFLDAIEWNLQSDLDEMEAVLSKVEYGLVKQRLQWRQFMTYSDLQILTGNDVLFSPVALLELVQKVIQVFAVLTITYVAIGTLTLTVSASILAGIPSTHKSHAATHFNDSLLVTEIPRTQNYSPVINYRTRLNLEPGLIRERRINSAGIRDLPPCSGYCQFSECSAQHEYGILAF